MKQPRRHIFTSLRTFVHNTSEHASPTEMLPVIDDALAARILDLAVRIGESSLVAGASASDVTLTIVRVAGAYGLDPVHVNVTYNSITAASHRGDDGRPITILRVVRAATPDYEKLRTLQGLVSDVRRGLPLDDARDRLRTIRRTPFRYQPVVVIGAQALLAVGVAVMFGVNPLNIALAFVAAALAATTQHLLAKGNLPFFFSQIAGGFVLTMVAACTPLLILLGWATADAVRPSVIVAAGIVLMLAGLTVVGAAQDAIDGFALTAMGRILELVTQTLGVVLGILIGLQTARVVGIAMPPPTEALPFGPVPLQFVGAALIALSVALINGAGLRIVLTSAALSVVAWLGYLGAVTIGFDPAAAAGLGAFMGSFVGILLAYRLHVPSVAVTTAAILPMVPGAAVFRGLLWVVESGDNQSLMFAGFATLASAATIGVSLAVGASLGIYLGQPLRDSLASVVRSRVRSRDHRRRKAGGSSTS